MLQVNPEMIVTRSVLYRSPVQSDLVSLNWLLIKVQGNYYRTVSCTSRNQNHVVQVRNRGKKNRTASPLIMHFNQGRPLCLA